MAGSGFCEVLRGGFVSGKWFGISGMERLKIFVQNRSPGFGEGSSLGGRGPPRLPVGLEGVFSVTLMVFRENATADPCTLTARAHPGSSFRLQDS